MLHASIHALLEAVRCPASADAAQASQGTASSRLTQQQDTTQATPSAASPDSTVCAVGSAKPAGAANGGASKAKAGPILQVELRQAQLGVLELSPGLGEIQVRMPTGCQLAQEYGSRWAEAHDLCIREQMMRFHHQGADRR